MKKIILSALLLISINIAKAQQYTINAQLIGFEDRTKFYLKDISMDQNIDSAEIIHGKLTMKGKISSVKALWFCCSYKGQFYFTNLLIGADDIKISGDKKDFPWYVKISGSKSQDISNKLNSDIRHLWKGRDSLMNILAPMIFAKQNDSIRAIIKPLAKAVNKLDSAREAITATFIANNINSYAALQQLYYKKDDYKREELQSLMSQLTPTFKTSVFANLITSYLKVGNILKKGSQFYDFTAADINGTPYTLSNYKGKYILIDFVETYCVPCIEAAGDLTNLSKKYTDQLQVISFYVENKKEVMKIGLERDRPSWPCIWDGKGHEGEIKMKYGVSGFPTFVLIAPDGKIVLHTSGFSKDDDGNGSLEKAVDKILQKGK